jgi:hypothetical protein
LIKRPYINKEPNIFVHEQPWYSVDMRLGVHQLETQAMRIYPPKDKPRDQCFAVQTVGRETD